MKQPNLDFLIIAVDFDGTIVEHTYPDIGREVPFSIDTIKRLQNEGHKMILWTFRAGPRLDEAVEYCRRKGLEFYAVNSNNPDEIFDIEKMSRKINADVYIDDRNFGGLPSWGEIYQKLGHEQVDFNAKRPTTENKSFLAKLKDLFD